MPQDRQKGRYMSNFETVSMEEIPARTPVAVKTAEWIDRLRQLKPGTALPITFEPEVDGINGVTFDAWAKVKCSTLYKQKPKATLPYKPAILRRENTLYVCNPAVAD